MYKERADIEAEYSKRLSKLSKQNFGKDETGSMRAAIEVVRMELDQTSKTHADLSNLVKKDLEGQMAEFLAKAQNQRKNTSAQIEKLYKQKQTQESYVNKSKDKYEQDCIKINGYTAQSSLVQGRDLDKVNTKLDKAQSTVSNNDKDYQNFVRALKDTTHRWNSEWKVYLDQCQDQEEERLEFVKGNLWNYANAVSAVCVADDESCERVRVSLEGCEAPRDIIDFIQRAGTGSAIADPPEYINYSKGQPPPARPTFKSANFQRSTTRQTSYIPTAPPSVPLAAPTTAVPVAAASAGPDLSSRGTESQMLPLQARKDSLGTLAAQSAPLRPSVAEDEASQSFRPPPGAVGLPGIVSQGAMPNMMRDEAPDASLADPSRPDKRMSARNFMARTPSMNKTSRGGGQGPMHASETNSTVSTSHTTIDNDDPIAKALANLRMRPGGKSPGPQSPGQGPSTPGKIYGSVGPNRAVSPSASHEPRARSPSAAFMQEPERATSPLPVEEVLGQYGQHFPGERRALSRQNSSASRTSRMSVQPGPPPHERARSPGPPADAGYAGVGAQGRSPSPQPFHRGQTPQRQPQAQQPQVPLHQQQQRPGGSQGKAGPTSSMHQIAPPRSTTPLGIALDAKGSVTHDQMADEFIKRSGSVGPGQVAHSASQPAAQRMQSHFSSSPSPMHSLVASTGHGYAQQPSLHQQQSYSSHQSQPSMAVHYAQQQQQQPPQQQQQQPHGYAPPHAVQQDSAPVQFAYQQQPQQPPQGYAPQHAVHQESMSSLGRQSGYAAVQSPYNQTPAAAAVHTPTPQPGISQPPTPAPGPPAAHGYGQQGNSGQYGVMAAGYQGQGQETPASAYMQQYRQQSHHTQPSPVPSAPTPGLPGQQQSYQQVPQQQQPPAAQWANQPPPGANVPYAGQGQYSQQQQQQPQLPHQQQQQPPSRSGTAPPTGQFSDTGKPILFYVKALYDYHATTDEEFSFTAGDVVAVWETNPDGWWQGELLDDARRRQGANTFPSNFVSLLT